MINAMIYSLACCGGVLGGKEKPGRCVEPRARAGVGVVVVCSLEQLEFFSPTDGRPSAVYPELAVNVSGVRAQGA
jgi:hypothetical protein